MRTSWMRAGMALGIAALALILLAMGTAWAAGGGSSGLAAVVSGWVGGDTIVPMNHGNQGQGQSGTSIEAHKTAEGFWTHVITYDWSITKTVSPDDLTLALGESGEVTYWITATRHVAAEVETAGVRGTICVTNTGAVTTTGLAITDVVEVKTGSGQPQPFITVTVNVSAKPVLNPGETYCYPYQIPFKPSSGVHQYRNHAIVTILNHSGHLGEPFGPEPKADFSLPEHPITVTIDASATVTDTEHCPSGFTCTPSETGPWTFHDSDTVSFHKTITNEAVCDATSVLHNIATLTESDTHETRTAEAVVHLTAPPCPVAGGCVLTQGFWKTHPDAWPEGHHPNDLFFSSGKTWMEVLWTAPRGDAYYILAHQYIAAALNAAADASMPDEVQDAFEDATAWFETHSPGVHASSSDGQTAIHLAEILAAFNEGRMGVPHCEGVEAGPANPPKRGSQRPETPPGLENRPESPPGQEHRPSTPPGQGKGKGK
ncbi:hypothetical protein [Thermoflexus sp.]|uniref:hypothetical protein n=1 Tax=Thermoflexus sp. TaxID=1969742 RepID=UPI0035E408F2